MASTVTYTSEQELRNLYKGLKEEQLINLLINQHHTIRELSKNITVTHCCKSDSELLFALLDWIDYGYKEDKKYIVETFLKDIYSK